MIFVRALIRVPRPPEKADRHGRTSNVIETLKNRPPGAELRPRAQHAARTTKAATGSKVGHSNFVGTRRRHNLRCWRGREDWASDRAPPKRRRRSSELKQEDKGNTIYELEAIFRMTSSQAVCARLASDLLLFCYDHFSSCRSTLCLNLFLPSSSFRINIIYLLFVFLKPSPLSFSILFFTPIFSSSIISLSLSLSPFSMFKSFAFICFLL